MYLSAYARARAEARSQNVQVAQPAIQLNATEQDTLVKQIGIALLRAAPGDWRRMTVDFRAVGRYHEMTGEITTDDGSTHEWVATHDIATLFGRLRGGMYREARGTWFNARYQLDHPSSYNLEYDREEPRWHLAPPLQAYLDELRTFPRSDENVPEWLARKISGLSPETPATRMRMARVFDGIDPAGRPLIHRGELALEEQNRMLEYLDSAPIVLSERRYDLDRLASSSVNSVPVAFHTDGLWIWPAAVNFYLREYGISPEPDLVHHLRSMDFALPEIPEQMVQGARTQLRRANPPSRPQQAPAAVEEPQNGDPTHRVEPPFEEFDTSYQSRLGPPRFDSPESGIAAFSAADSEAFGTTVFNAPVNPAPNPPIAEPTSVFAVPENRSAHAAPEMSVEEHEQADERAEVGRAVSSDNPATRLLRPVSPPHAPQGTPYAPQALPQTEHGHGEEPAIAPSQNDPAIEELRSRFDKFDIPGTSYQIGQPIERGWSLEQVDDGWRVGWYDGELTSPAVFGDADDAAAFMLGKMLLARDKQTEDPQGFVPSEEPTHSIPSPEHTPSAQNSSDAFFESGFFRQEQAEAVSDQDDYLATSAGVPHETPRWDEGNSTPSLVSEPVPSNRHEPEEFELFTHHPPEESFQTEPQQPEPFIEAAAPIAAEALAARGFEGRPEESRKPTPTETPVTSVTPATPVESVAREIPQPVAVPPRPINTLTPQPAVPVSPAGAAPTGVSPAGAASSPTDSRQGAGNQQWLIKPLAGEPPLTLFRGKELSQLPVGSELDRFGDSQGNLTYVAGTPFQERSLVPEWIDRPYHVYRVQRPLEALAGIAIPWFNQPGGGSAYLLPGSIEELVARGDLLELEPGEPPMK
jgi:hypothetical protein